MPEGVGYPPFRPFGAPDDGAPSRPIVRNDYDSIGAMLNAILGQTPVADAAAYDPTVAVPPDDFVAPVANPPQPAQTPGMLPQPQQPGGGGGSAVVPQQSLAPVAPVAAPTTQPPVALPVQGAAQLYNTPRGSQPQQPSSLDPFGGIDPLLWMLPFGIHAAINQSQATQQGAIGMDGRPLALPAPGMSAGLPAPDVRQALEAPVAPLALPAPTQQAADNIDGNARPSATDQPDAAPPTRGPRDTAPRDSSRNSVRREQGKKPLGVPERASRRRAGRGGGAVLPQVEEALTSPATQEEAVQPRTAAPQAPEVAPPATPRPEGPNVSMTEVLRLLPVTNGAPDSRVLQDVVYQITGGRTYYYTALSPEEQRQVVDRLSQMALDRAGSTTARTVGKGVRGLR